MKRAPALGWAGCAPVRAGGGPGPGVSMHSKATRPALGSQASARSQDDPLASRPVYAKGRRPRASARLKHGALAQLWGHQHRGGGARLPIARGSERAPGWGTVSDAWDPGRSEARTEASGRPQTRVRHRRPAGNYGEAGKARCSTRTMGEGRKNASVDWTYAKRE